MKMQCMHEYAKHMLVFCSKLLKYIYIVYKLCLHHNYLVRRLFRCDTIHSMQIFIENKKKFKPLKLVTEAVVWERLVSHESELSGMEDEFSVFTFYKQ
jgi:hypothetical protein